MVHDVAPRRSRLRIRARWLTSIARFRFRAGTSAVKRNNSPRFLVSMEHTNVPFDVVLNKSDLVDEVTKDDWAARLEQWGYTPRFVSVATGGEGISELEARPGAPPRSEATGRKRRRKSRSERPYARVTVLAGPSRVGKETALINRLRAGARSLERSPRAGELGGASDASIWIPARAAWARKDPRSRSGRRPEVDDERGKWGTSRRTCTSRTWTSAAVAGARGAWCCAWPPAVELQSRQSRVAKLGRRAAHHQARPRCSLQIRELVSGHARVRVPR